MKWTFVIEDNSRVFEFIPIYTIAGTLSNNRRHLQEISKKTDVGFKAIISESPFPYFFYRQN